MRMKISKCIIYEISFTFDINDIIKFDISCLFTEELGYFWRKISSKWKEFSTKKENIFKVEIFFQKEENIFKVDKSRN